jgi:hypothetical protein
MRMPENIQMNPVLGIFTAEHAEIAEMTTEILIPLRSLRSLL